MLQNAYSLVKFGFDTAENEPAKKLQNFATTNARSLGVANFAACSAADLLLLEEVRELRAERAELGLRRRGPVGLLAEPREVVLQRGLGGAAIDPLGRGGGEGGLDTPFQISSF